MNSSLFFFSVVKLVLENKQTLFSPVYSGCSRLRSQSTWQINGYLKEHTHTLTHTLTPCQLQTMSDLCLSCCTLSLSGLLSPMKKELLLQLQSEIENVTDAWLSTALKSLLHIQSRSEQRTRFKTNKPLREQTNGSERQLVLHLTIIYKPN